MTNDSDSLIREVEEELRRERIAKLWEQYGALVVGAAVAIVVGVGGYKFWQARTQAAAERAGGQYEQATKLFSSGKPAEATKALKALSQSGHPGYAILAKLRLAGRAVEAKKPGEAVTYYEQIAKDPDAQDIFRDFAILQIASLKLSEESWTDIKNRLTEVSKDGRPWRFAARELIGIAAFRAGKYDEVRQALAELVGNNDVPSSIRQRAQVILGLVAAKGGGTPAKADKATNKATNKAATGETTNAKGKSAAKDKSQQPSK